MKITYRPESRKLTVAYWGRFFWVGSLGLGLTVLGITLGYVSSRGIVLKCRQVEPQQVNCQWVSDDILAATPFAGSLNRVQQATLETIVTEEESYYQLLLTSPKTAANLFLMPSQDRRQVQRYVDQINQFLSDRTQTTLELTMRPELTVPLILVLSFWGAVSVLLLLAAGASLLRVEAWVDDQTGSLHLRHRYLFGSQQRTLSPDNIQVVKQTLSSGDEPLYRVDLVLPAGEIIDLGFMSSSEAQAIALFSVCDQFLADARLME